jgi:TonB family protein
MKKLSLVMAFVAVSAFSVLAQVPSEIKGGILNGKATSLPKPDYPEAAKGAGIEGVVYVNVVIDEEGNVISAVADDQVRKVYKQGKDGEKIEEEQPVADALLRDAALRAAWNAKFSPTRLSGVPVKVTGTIVYNFVAADSVLTVSRTANAQPTRIEAVDPEVKGAISGGVMNSKAIMLPAPAYPPAAKAVRAQGAVSVKVTVDEEGNVISASAVSGHPLLRAAATEAAKGARFSQTLLNGAPVKVTGIVTYNFVAPDSSEN